MKKTEPCLEDLEKEHGFTLTKEMCEMATERLIRDWGGYQMALEAIQDYLEMEIGSMDADIDEGDDQVVSAEERSQYNHLRLRLNLIIRMAKKVDAIYNLAVKP